MITTKQQTKGFTIIEVVLVLAIAALIFLMIFIALPAMQRGQRDTARKQDVGSVATAISTYRSNNQNKMPAAGSYTSANTTGFGGYLFGGNSKVSSNTGTIVINANVTTTVTGAGATDAQIEVWPQGKCNSTTVGTIDKGTPAGFAVTTKLEAGNGTPFCQDS